MALTEKEIHKNLDAAHHYSLSQSNVVGTQDWTAFVKEKLFFVTAEYVKRAVWIPAKTTTKKPPVVVIAIHGTFAKDSPDFHSDQEGTYRGVKRFARDQAKKNASPALLISFIWSGGNHEPRRKAAGSALASLLKVFSEPHAASRIVVLTHSHGGNIANFASHIISRPIDLLVNIATPRRNQEHYKQGNVLVAYNFYSTSDPVQVAGAVVQEDFFASLLENVSRRKQPFQKGKRIVNVNTKISGRSPGHIMIKDLLLPVLPQVLAAIERLYTYHDDLFVNIHYAKNRTPQILAAINQYATARGMLERGWLTNGNEKKMFKTLDEEVKDSIAQESAYFALYPRYKHMRDKGSVASRMYHILLDAYHVMYKILYRMKYHTTEFLDPAL